MATDAFALTGNKPIKHISPQRVVAELLGKRWMEAVVPVILLVGLAIYCTTSVPGFLSSTNQGTLGRLVAEVGLVAIGMTVVLLAGGIDVSVGAQFGLVNISSLIMFKVWGWPVPLVILVSLVLGAMLGGLNGALVAFAKTRPFITTLVTLLLFRTMTQYLEREYATDLAVTFRDDPTWDWLSGYTGGTPNALLLLVVIAPIIHLVLSRTRFGWRITAVGSSRTAARRAGISLPRMVVSSFMLAGVLTALAGLLTASHLEQSSSSTGVGMELTVLTAVVLGGVSLSGGRGTAPRALIGALVVAMLDQAIRLEGLDRNLYTTILAVTLLVFVTIDVKWGKNRSKAIQKIFMVPGTVELPAMPDINDPSSVWYLNDRLSGAEAIGLGKIEGPEDVILDAEGRMYCGDRRGYIWRFSGPDLQDGEIFCRVGGHPLGLAFDAAGNLLVCVGGMGLYSIDPSGDATRLTSEAPRTWYKVVDDSPIRLADDVDVAPDGSIYFSDATARFDVLEWHFEILESRPNGRVLKYDPTTGDTTVVIKNSCFPNGICVSHDQQSILINQTVLGRIDRYWIAGPKAGTLEPFSVGLPGVPDNINRSSDGGYWVAFAGMRTPTFDLTMRHPSFRRRMTKELPLDEWLLPNLNTSCVIKVTEEGEVVDCLWDAAQVDHATVTSMREFDGYLYLGGLNNNRIGRVKVGPSRADGDLPADALVGIV